MSKEKTEHSFWWFFCFTYKYPPYFGGIILIKTSIKVSVVDPFKQLQKNTKIHQKNYGYTKIERTLHYLTIRSWPIINNKDNFSPSNKKMQVNLWHHLNQFTLKHQKALANYLLHGNFQNMVLRIRNSIQNSVAFYN